MTTDATVTAGGRHAAPAAALHARDTENPWLDCDRQADLDDVGPFVTQAADATAEFLHRTP